MKRAKYGLWLVFALALVATASCGTQPAGDSPESPLSPVRTPIPGLTELEPQDWTPVTFENTSGHFVEIQIYAPLAWTDLDWDGELIWAANNVTYELVAFDDSGESVQRIPFPQIDDLPCNVMGVATAGERIWIADVAHRYMYALDRDTGEVSSSFGLGNTAQGMDYDGESLWITTVEDNQLQRWSEQGELLDSYPLEGIWTTGVTWDGNQIWYVDKAGQQIWTWDPVTEQGQPRRFLTELIHLSSFNAIEWTGNHLLLFSDMVGRLYAVPVQ